MRRHAVPSAVAPVFGLMIVTMPVVVTNLVLIEQIYSIPVFVAVAGLVAELALIWLDPRLRARAAA